MPLSKNFKRDWIFIVICALKVERMVFHYAKVESF